MTTPVFHPCVFDFSDQDIRRIGSVTSGGTALSGVDDPIQSDGGGFWQADFTNGETLDRETTMAWRAITAQMDNGSAAIVVRFCDKLHQPGGGEMGVANRPRQLGDGRVYAKGGVTAHAFAAAALRATQMTIEITSELPLIGGEKFTVVHEHWGERCYEVLTVAENVITFRPPLREAVAMGEVLDFDDPRCRMRMASAPSNALNIGMYGQCAISFVEDMRKPADA